MIDYEQSTGKVIDEHGEVQGVGYSGHEIGKNNPSFERVRFVGPVPCGIYELGRPYDSATHGPFVMALLPKPGTEVYGRTDFRVHGDNKKFPGQASQGCICAPRDVREWMDRQLDRRVRVVPGPIPNSNPTEVT